MVQIIVSTVRPIARDAVVTGYAVAREQPRCVTSCPPTVLTRVYRGFGKVRAETGSPPRRGFGNLIVAAEITDVQQNQGWQLWLRIED